MTWSPRFNKASGGRFGQWFHRLTIGENGTAPVYAPINIKPQSAPSGTAQEGEVYWSDADNFPRFHNGSAWLLPSGKRVVKTAAATLTAADSGALCVFNSAAGDLYTLPVPEAGLWFDFVVTVTITSNAAKVITDSASTFLLGTFVQSTDGTYTSALHSANGTTHRAWSGNGTSTGGIKGDWFRLTAISATQWVIVGMGSATGSEATPFATS